MRILIIEDSPVESLMLRRILEKLGYEVTVTSNGQEGLDKLRESHIRLVLTDNNMPVMSGQEVCREVRANSDYGDPYIIMLTSGVGDNDLVRGMESGADDFLRKPYAAEELRVRIEAGCRLVEMRDELESKNHYLEDALLQVQEKQRMIDQDIAVAEQLVNQQMPEDTLLSANLDVAVDFKMAQRIGGDSFGFQSLSPDRHFFYQIDVMGHGVASALLSFSLTNTIRQLLNQHANRSRRLPSLHKLAKRLNNQFPSEKFAGHYFTLFLGLVDEKRSRLSFCIAGHPPPIVIDSDGESQPVPKGSFPVGLFDFADFTSHSLPFEPGAVMLVSSDGLFDMISPTDSKQGQTSIAELVSRSRALDATQIRDEIQALSKQLNPGPPPDDVSLIIIKHQGSIEEAVPDTTQGASHMSEKDTGNGALTLHIPPDPEVLVEMMDQVRIALEQQKVDEMTQMRLTTSLSELINNIILHGRCPDGVEKAPVEFSMCRTGPDIEVRVTDNTGRVPHLCPPTPLTLDRESGRGTHIMLSWIDQIKYQRSDSQNHWTLSFKPNG